MTKISYGFLLIATAARRQRRVLVAAVIALLVAVGLTLVLWPSELWRAWADWALTARSRPETTLTAYQPLTSLFGHLFRHEPSWNPTPVVDLPWLADGLWWLAVLALAGGTVIVSARIRVADGAGQLLTYGLAALAVPLLSPIAEDHAYVPTLLPILAVAIVLQRSVLGRSPVRLTAVGLAIALLGLPWQYEATDSAGWSALLYYPRLYGALLLWLIIADMLWCRRRHTRTGP